LAKKTKLPKRGLRTPTAGRKQLLVLIDEKVIGQIMDAAEEDGRTAWDVVEEASKQWLARRAKKR
jgi:hypothetical protein